VVPSATDPALPQNLCIGPLQSRSQSKTQTAMPDATLDNDHQELAAPPSPSVEHPLNRRKFLAGAVAAAATYASPVEYRRVAIFAPGIMGSSLTHQGVSIWSDDLQNNYEMLANLAAAFTGGPDYAQTSIIRRFRYGPVPLATVYERILKELRQIFASELLEFSYDWRQSVQQHPGALRRLLAARGVAFDSDGRMSGASPDFYLIGHSLGGLVLLLSVLRGIVAPEKVARLILIAPPLAGSPNAFERLCGNVGLPWFSLYLWGFSRENKKRRIREALQAMPGLYALLPKVDDPFLLISKKAHLTFLRDYRKTHPAKESIFTKAPWSEVISLQNELQAGLRTLPIPKERFRVIYSKSDTNTSESLFAGDPSRPCAVVKAGVTSGDGTVGWKSALYRGQVDTLAISMEVAGDHYTLCESKWVIKALRLALPL